MGLLSAILWQRFYRTKLPDYLGFFNGRRLVPILTAITGLVVGVLMAFVYPLFNSGLNWSVKQLLPIPLWAAAFTAQRTAS